MFLLKHNTTNQVIPLGFYLDSTDGDTAETSLTIANTDLQLWKSGATSLVSKNSGGATHMSIGVYQATLDASDTSVLGPIKIYSHVAGALVVVFEGLIVPITTYDAFVNDGLNNLGGVAQTADNDILLQDIPNNAEFNARTILTASYATATALSTVDSNVTAIKSKTDSLTFTVVDQVDVNMLTHTAPIPNNYITSTGIDANALDGKGDWNTITPPTAAQIWAEATRELTSGLNIVLAKGVGVTGFNDVSATDIVSNGAITTSSGNANVNIVKINGVTIVGDGSGSPFDV